MQRLGPEASVLVAAMPIACYRREEIDQYAGLEFYSGNIAWVKAQLLATCAEPRRIRRQGRLRRWFARLAGVRAIRTVRDV
jgi:hypothetical protein